jgi:hypothetical protein
VYKSFMGPAFARMVRYTWLSELSLLLTLLRRSCVRQSLRMSHALEHRRHDRADEFIPGYDFDIHGHY